jgi:hypothetical protein
MPTPHNSKLPRNFAISVDEASLFPFSCPGLTYVRFNDGSILEGLASEYVLMK